MGMRLKELGGLLVWVKFGMGIAGYDGGGWPGRWAMGDG